MSENIGSISESKFQKKVIEAVKKQYGFVFENKGSAIQRRGIPDLQIHLPWMKVFEDADITEDGVKPTSNLDKTITPFHIKLIPGGMLWLELKVQDGRIGKSQRKMMQNIKAAGGLAMVSMLMKSGEVRTWEIDKKDEKVFSSFLKTRNFETGVWLRQIINYYASESPPKKRAIKRVPLSYAKTFLDPSLDT